METTGRPQGDHRETTERPQLNFRRERERPQKDHIETTERPQGDHRETTGRPQRDHSQITEGSARDHRETIERPQTDHRETTVELPLGNRFWSLHPVCSYTMLIYTRGGVGLGVYEHCMDPLASDGASREKDRGEVPQRRETTDTRKGDRAT